MRNTSKVINLKHEVLGKRFGRLSVLEDIPGYRVDGKKIMRSAVCLCDCGTRHKLQVAALTSGAAKSCGCLSREIASDMCLKRNNKHGASKRGRITAEYRSWSHMKSRCYNKNDKNYDLYGGRGIEVFAAWQNDFGAFLEYIGKKPDASLSLDRIDNNGNYEPGNVKWSTQAEQVNNSRVITEKFKLNCHTCEKIIVVTKCHLKTKKYCSRRCHWDSKKGTPLAHQKKIQGCRMRQYRENDDQQNLVSWFRLQYPQFSDLLVHLPFGQNIGARAGARLKRSGGGKGWPDMFLGITTKTHPGLFIEMKSENGRLSKRQQDIHFQLINQRYKVVVCYSWSEALTEIEYYLEGFRGKSRFDRTDLAT